MCCCLHRAPSHLSAYMLTAKNRRLNPMALFIESISLFKLSSLSLARFRGHLISFATLSYQPGLIIF